MRLFHGSDCRVERPSVAFSRKSVDFGPGFYLTSFETQALRWARRKSMRSHSAPILNAYECDAQTTLDALSFFERNDQYCFASQLALDTLLSFEDAYEVEP